MSDFFHRRVNIFDIIKDVPKWIKYDKSVNVKFDYRIVRTMSHDGLVYFSNKLLLMALEPLLKMESYCTRTSPIGINADPSSVKNISYTIGDIHIMAVFGVVNIPTGRYPGQKECVFIPVVCKYIMSKQNEGNYE